MKKKTTSKVIATPQPEPVVATRSGQDFTEKPTIAKLEPFGNEDMHKVVAKINEIINAL